MPALLRSTSFSITAMTLAVIALTTLSSYTSANAQTTAAPDASSNKPVTEQIVDSLTKLAGGPHAGYRANHAKGIVTIGEFVPAPSAASITKAAHLQRTASKVTVRFSNASGVPNIPDANGNGFPKGMAIRFDLPKGVSTDMVVISTNGFPVGTPEDFLTFLKAIEASGPGVAKPTPVENFLATHPATLKFVTMSKPAPVSFATQAFYGVNAFKFTNAKGESHFGRYRIEPLAGQQFLSAEETEKATPNYLMDELPVRLKKEPVKFRISVQLAEKDDVINDGTQVWPGTRKIVELGTLTLRSVHADGSKFEKGTMFNPLTLLDGIAPSDDPILLARPAAYAVSFGRRLSNP